MNDLNIVSQVFFYGVFAAIGVWSLVVLVVTFVNKSWLYVSKGEKGFTPDWLPEGNSFSEDVGDWHYWVVFGGYIPAGLIIFCFIAITIDGISGLPTTPLIAAVCLLIYGILRVARKAYSIQSQFTKHEQDKKAHKQ